MVEWLKIGQKMAKFRNTGDMLVSNRCMVAKMKRCLQVHDIFVCARELVHNFVLLLLALQREHVLQRRQVAQKQLLHL